MPAGPAWGRGQVCVEGAWKGWVSNYQGTEPEQDSSLGSAGAIQPDALGDPGESLTPSLCCPLRIPQTPGA